MGLILSTGRTRAEMPAFTVLPTCKPKEVIWTCFGFKSKELGGIIGGYYNFDCEEIEDAKHNAVIKDVKQHRRIVIDPNLTWFGEHILAAGLAGHYILYGNAYAIKIIHASAKAAMPDRTATAAASSVVPTAAASTTAVTANTTNKTATIKPAKTADILKVILRSQDPRNRSVEETLFGTAVIANSVDPLLDLKVHHGFVEQIRDSGHITERDTTATFKRVLPMFGPNESFDAKTQSAPNWKPYWQRVTDARMKPFKDANLELAEAIINNEVPQDGDEKEREACPAVKRFRKKIEIDPKEVIQVGITMDIMTAVSFIQFIVDNQGPNRFAVANTYKADNALIIVFGSMLGLAAADDAQVANHGSWNVVNNKELPPRSLILKNRSPYYSSGPTGLGFTLFLEYRGLWSRGRRSGVGREVEAARALENLCQTKTSTLQRLCNN